MTTLDDLRSTLVEHADGLDDTDRHVRPGAVRARVRAVRRRRAVAAVAAAVVVLGGVAGVGALRGPDTTQPAERVVAGVDVPDSIDVLGFPYRLRDLNDVDGTLHLDATDRHQAVLLAASGLGEGSATLFVDGQAVARVRGAEGAATAYPIADADADLRIRLDGAGEAARAGVAVYEATGELAPGVDNGQVVFRDEYAGQPLLGAAFAEPDQSSVEFETDGAPVRGASGMLFAFHCDGPDALYLNVEIDGEPSWATGCGSSATDAVAGSTATFGDLDPSRPHAVRVYLTRGYDGPEVGIPGVSFGAGAYASERTGELVRRPDIVAERVEYAGRTWVLGSVEVAPPAKIDAYEDLLVGLVGTGRELRASWAGRLSDGGTVTLEALGRGASTLGGVLLAGDRYDVTVTGGEGRLLIYREE